MLHGCSPSHDNPNDPASPWYREPEPLTPAPNGAISGAVTSLFQPTYGHEIVELRLEATAVDSDGIDSVWALSDAGFLGTLYATENPNAFTLQLDEVVLPFAHLEGMIGHPVWFYYRDGSGDSARSEDYFLTRVIYTPPLDTIPTEGDTIRTRHPTLAWTLPYSLQFSYTFTVEVARVWPNFAQTPVFQRSGIPDSVFQIVVEPDSLIPAPRYYSWSISVVDEFGNRASSLESTFVIADGE